MSVAVYLNVSQLHLEKFRQVCEKAQTDVWSNTWPPHMTLVGLEKVDMDMLCKVTGCFARTLNPINIWVASIGTFPIDPVPVCVFPAATLELLQLHERFYQSLGNMADASQPYYRPHTWVPHLALSMRSSLAEALHIIEIAYHGDLRDHYLLDELVIAEFSPMKIIASYKLPSP